MGAVTALLKIGSSFDYQINCGSLGVLIVLFEKRVDGTGLLHDFEIKIKRLIDYRDLIPPFELLQSKGDSEILMECLKPVLLCFNYNPPSTLNTIAASIKKFMEMRNYICALPGEESGVRVLRLRVFVPGNDDDEKIQTISSFLLGNKNVSKIPVNVSGDLKSIYSDCVNGILRESKLKWKFVWNSVDEWTIFIFISRIKTATQNLADYSMIEHMNKDDDEGDRPTSLLSKMDSRNNQFTSTLRVLNRVLDTASTGLSRT